MNGSRYLFKSVYKRRNKFKGLITRLVLIGIAIWIIYIMTDIYGWLGDPTEKTIEISDGSNLTQVAEQLKDEKIISHPLLFKIIAKYTIGNQSIQMGNHTLRSNMSYITIINELRKVPQPEGIKITIPEGFESYRIADVLSEKGLVDREEFLKKVNSKDYDYEVLSEIKRTSNCLEGYLYPATYVFHEGATVDEIINTFLKKFDEEFDQSMKDRVEQLNMTVDQVVTLASIIEREASCVEEMPIISSVFHNRLKKNSKYPYLQSCATIQYLLKERKPILTKEDTKIKSPYNTYLNKGLPPGPIANPGKAAIMAALYPKETDYNFFVLNKEGTKHIYSVTYAEHQRAVKENQ